MKVEGPRHNQRLGPRTLNGLAGALVELKSRARTRIRLTATVTDSVTESVIMVTHVMPHDMSHEEEGRNVNGDSSSVKLLISGPLSALTRELTTCHTCVRHKRAAAGWVEGQRAVGLELAPTAPLNTPPVKFISFLSVCFFLSFFLSFIDLPVASVGRFVLYAPVLAGDRQCGQQSML